MFKFELSQRVKISISGETGFVKAQAQYAEGPNQILVHYKAADGRAVDCWFQESELQDNSPTAHDHQIQA